MGLTAKEFADKHAISSRKIKPWYEKGYLGSTTKDEKTGVYDIPEDTPVPYSADGRIKRIPKFWEELLDAAQNQNSVFSGMYPYIKGEVFASQIKSFIDAGFIRQNTTQSGPGFLEITTLGYEFMNALSVNERKRAFEKIERRVATGATFVQAICAVIPVVQQLFLISA